MISAELVEAHLDKVMRVARVIRARSISQAAQELGVSQPALSTAVATLEQILGRQLIRRSPAGIEPTPAGLVLLRLASEASALSAQLAVELSESEVRGDIRLGMYDSIAVYLAPWLYGITRKAQRELRINLVVGRSAELATAVRRGECDAAVVVDPPRASGLRRTKLRADKFAAYESTEASDVERDRIVTMAEACDAEGRNIRAHLTPWLKPGRELLDVGSFEAVRAMTLAGIGVGVMPTLVADMALKAGQLQQVGLPGMPRSTFGLHGIYLCTSERGYADPRVAWLRKQLAQPEGEGGMAPPSTRRGARPNPRLGSG